MKIECLRAASVRLSLALLLGLLVVPGYVVAPMLFARFDATLAGQIAGGLFHISNRGILILAIAVALFWWRSRASAPKGRLQWGLLVSILLLIAINEFAIGAHLADLKAQLGAIEALPKSDPGRAEFGRWHGVSAVIHLAASLAAAVLVGLGGHRGGSACRSS